MYKLQAVHFIEAKPNPIRYEPFFKDMIEIIHATEAKDEIRLTSAGVAHIKASLEGIICLS